MSDTVHKEREKIQFNNNKVDFIHSIQVKKENAAFIASSSWEDPVCPF